MKTYVGVKVQIRAFLTSALDALYWAVKDFQNSLDIYFIKGDCNSFIVKTYKCTITYCKSCNVVYWLCLSYMRICNEMKV
jgi:hypothetical protein